jgi:ankyrin repeat protein
MLARFLYLQLRTHKLRKMKKINLVWFGLLILMIFAGESASLAAPPALLDAARKGDLKQIQKLLDSGVDVNQRDKTGFTALHWAAMANRKEVAELLIQKKADINAREFQFKLSPLGVAQSRGFKDMAELLIKNGAKP